MKINIFTDNTGFDTRTDTVMYIGPGFVRLDSEKLDCEAEASEIRDAVNSTYLNLEILPRNVGNTVRCHTVPSPRPPPLHPPKKMI